MSSFSFKTIDVPAAAGTYTYIGVTGVDASGDAVGYFGNVDGDGDGSFHGFIALVNGNGIPLDPPGSTNTSVGMTASGVIFGDYTYLNHQYGFVDDGGVFTTYDSGIGEAAPPTVPLDISTDVAGITNAGVVYGDYADYVINNDNQPGWQGFLNNNGVVTLVSFPGANITTLADINSAGTIVGNYEFGGNTNAGWINHGFVDSNGSFTSIDVPGAYSTSVVGISDGGVIAGNYQDNASNEFGFVDNNGAFTTLSIPGGTNIIVNAINAAGEIVGDYFGADSKVHGFIDNNGVVTTVDVPGSTFTEIDGINANGQIFGSYDDSMGNQHGFVGTISTTTIESFGATSLIEAGNDFFLYANGTATGPELKYGGAPWTAGEWGAWTPIGAEATATGYEVAFKVAGADQYTVWNTDANGNITADSIGSVTGSSLTLEAIETSFHQDLNGDGVIGLPPTSTLIESFGSTDLVQTGSNYFLDRGDNSTELQYDGAAFVAGQWGGWTPIGVEATATGYEVAFKLAGADEYTVWNTDANGNITVDPIGTVAGESPTLVALERSFQQDLNGDGMIGNPAIAITVESSGSTSLVLTGNDYFLYANGTSNGPTLKYDGAAWTDGEWGGWTPIGAEATATGYEVAFNLAGTNQYTVWNTNSGGNIASDTIGTVTANSAALEAAETSFHQDLNGDGIIGDPSIPLAIESSGSTSLTEISGHFFLYANGTSNGPELSYGGAPWATGQWGGWAPIGAEATTTGYEVAFKLAGSDLYTVWNTDLSGNITSNSIGSVPGGNTTLQSIEASFYQDLNGDGVIDSPTTVIEAKGHVVLTLNAMTQPASIDAGATLELTGADSGAVTFNGPTGTLVLDHSTGFSGQMMNLTGTGNLPSSDQLDLRDIGFGPGTTAGYSGTAAGGILTVSDAQNHTAHIALAGDYTHSTFTLSSDGKGGTTVIDPVDNQPAATGTLSFNDPDATGTPSVSVTAQSGGAGYLGSFVADAVKAANGQDTVGWHFNFDSGPAAGNVTQSYAVTVADHHADGTSSATTQTVSVTIGGPGNDGFVFHPGVGSDTIVHAASIDTIELDGFAALTSNRQLATLLSEAQAGQPQTLFESVNGGHDTLINLGNHDSITLTDVQIADLHASHFIIH